MKKVNIYTSKAGQGKSFVMMIDAVKLASEGKKVAYISADLSNRFVIKRMNHIAKYLGLKDKISKDNLVVFNAAYGDKKEIVNKIEKIKKDFEVLFLDPFEAFNTYGHSPEKPMYKRTQEAYMELLEVLNSEDSILENINTTTRCYSNVSTGSVEVMGSVNKVEGLEGKVVLKKYMSRNSYLNDSMIVTCDFENKKVEEYNLTQIMK